MEGLALKAHRRFATLIETLLVIFILGLLLGLVGINVNKAVHEQRFKTEVALVVNSLRVAQYIMLILDNDVHVKFKKKEKSISMEIEATCPLKGWDKILLAPRELYTIHVVNFKDRLVDKPAKPGSVDIRFLSNGYVMSQGILRLATTEASDSDKGLESFICLPGYPATLSSAEQRPDEPECYSLLEKGSVDTLTNHIVNEIRGFQEKNREKPAEQKKSQENEKNDKGS